jgi:hypothetical protein
LAASCILINLDFDDKEKDRKIKLCLLY